GHKQPAATRAARLLTQYADFVRAHLFGSSGDVEITVGFWPSAPSQHSPEEVRTLWIEPLETFLLTETPYEEPGAANPQLRKLPMPAFMDPKPAQPAHVPEEATSGLRRRIEDQAEEIRDLRKTIHQRDAQIREFRAGGVGIHAPQTSPDIESLMTALRQ